MGRLTFAHSPTHSLTPALPLTTHLSNLPLPPSPAVVFVAPTQSSHFRWLPSLLPQLLPRPNWTGTTSLRYARRLPRTSPQLLRSDITYQQQHRTIPTHYFPCTRIPTAISVDSAAHHSSGNAFANSNCRCSPIPGTTVTPRIRDPLSANLILPPSPLPSDLERRAELHLTCTLFRTINPSITFSSAIAFHDYSAYTLSI